MTASRSYRRPPLVAGSLLLHALALPLAAAVPALRRPAAAALFLDHVALAAAGMLPRSRALGPNLCRMPGAPGARVALTFDDGPDPDVTPAVLARLAAHGARATFFCIGERVARHPDLVAEIAAAGHRVENHTHRHLHRFSMLGPRALAGEIDRAQEAIAEATGAAPALVRPPAGIRSPLLEPLLARRGLWLASWTRRGYDTVRRDPERVLGALVRDLAAGDVLLLHDGNAARTPSGSPVVLEVLPRLLDRLAASGLAASPLLPPDPPSRPAAR